MRVVFYILFALILLPFGAAAQDDDRGFLTRTLEDALSGLGREVRIEGFRGALSSQASFDTMTIADGDGVWMTLEDVTLDWRRAALLRGRLEVTELTANRLDLPRLPAAEDDGIELPQAEAQGFSLPDLPVTINIQKFSVAEIALGAPLLGEAVVLSLSASARLDDAGLETRIDAQRADGQEGDFGVSLQFARDTSVLDIDLALDEQPGGLLARLVNLPDQPAVALSVKGEGPPSNFAADINLSTAGIQRVTGRVTMEGSTPEAPGDRRINANISGDIAPLVAPEYSDFFGSDVALLTDAVVKENGIIELERFALQARALDISGTATLNQDRWPVLIDVSGRMASPDGTPVVLPGGGGATVAGATLSVAYDAESGEAFSAEVLVESVEQEAIRVANARIEMDGTLQGNLGSVGQFLADLTIAAQGLEFTDPQVSQAVGRDLVASTQINFIEGQPVRLSDLVVQGAGLDAAGWVIIGAPADGLPTRLSLSLGVEELARFAALAQQPIAGAAQLEVAGQVAPLNGTFDLTLKGRTRDLRIDVQQADDLLKGTTELSVSARRDSTGTFVDNLKLDNAALSARADARIQTGESDVTAAASLTDLGVVLPGYPGAARVEIAAQQDARGWSVQADADAPQGAKVTLDGLATGPDAALNFMASLPNLAVFVPQIPGPLSVEGKALRAPDGWRVQTNAEGPSGTSAVVSGLVGDEGALNLAATGVVPLGLSRPFIAPRSVQGQARFDLRVQGPPALSSVTGEISTANATVSAPNLRIALEGLATQVRLNGGRADVTASANVVSGGRIGVNGAVSLTGAPSVNLDVQLNNVVVIDPRLFRTQVGGAISVTGPLSAGPRISGVINVGETLVSVPASGLTTIGDIPQINHIGSPRGAADTRQRAGLNAKAAEQSSDGGGGLPLDIQINAPGRIFVRGRGINAELGGALRLTGTTGRIISAGAFELVRGRLDILAKRFELVEGSTQFQGSLTPYIRFVTQTTTQAGTASIIVDGPADSPEVTFAATPDAPQDEVLSQLLFGRDLSEISAFQALQLANAVATLAGGSGVGLIGGLRNGFGLDELDITTGEDGQTAVRAGKYISDNVYTDVTAGADGNTDISLNIDISSSLTAKGTAGSDGETALGIFFEKDY